MRILLASALAVFAVACQSGVGPDGVLVGRVCTTDRDCASSCLTGSDEFRGGMCTIVCRADSDCPNGTVCVNQKGNGICAIYCRAASDCDAFGRSWSCGEVGRFPTEGNLGKAAVCRVP